MIIIFKSPQVETLCQQDSERGIHEVNHNNQCYKLYPTYNEILIQQDSERGIPRTYYNSYSHEGTYDQQDSERGIPEVIHNTQQLGISGKSNRSNSKWVSKPQKSHPPGGSLITVTG